MEHVDFEEQVSITIDDHETVDSDIEINSSISSSNRFGFFTRNGMIKLEEGNCDHEIVKRSFLNGMGKQGNDANVVAVHRNSFSSTTGRARLETFRVFSDAVAKKCGGDANVKHAWFGGSRNEICEIISHGFSRIRQHENGEFNGFGVHLSPARNSLDGALMASEDEDGLRHLLLCRVILGNMEVVYGGSKQFQPSSNEFDSGVDNLSSPRRYIVWSSYMNSHILPGYIISFKSTLSRGCDRIETNKMKPTSPYMMLPTLMSMLSRFLPPSKMGLIGKYHTEFRESKISRSQLIRRFRQIAGDKLLASVIKFCRNKQSDARSRSTSMSAYQDGARKSAGDASLGSRT